MSFVLIKKCVSEVCNSCGWANIQLNTSSRFFTMTYLNGIGGIKPKINMENETYQIITVSGTNVQRWQDVRVEILNNVINNKSIDLF